MTEQVLDEAIEWSGSEGGTILVYNPEDGGIMLWRLPQGLTLTITGNTASFSPQSKAVQFRHQQDL